MSFKINNLCFSFIALTAFLTTFVVPAIAENRFVDSRNAFADDKPVADDVEESGLDKTLEHNFSPEDRARLRKALADYAKTTDPEHNQIELKRKAMKESVDQRFNECNKDNDETIDRQEATECLPQVARHFSFVDVDEDGVITIEELELAQAKSIERKKAAEAKVESDQILATEAEIKNKNKNKVNKQALNNRKRPI